MKVFECQLSSGGGWQEPVRVVIHAMGERIMYKGKPLHATEFLEKVGLSAHRLVDSFGNQFKCREDNQIAYHAKGHNTNTLGLEFLVPVPDVIEAFDYDSFLAVMETNYTTKEMLESGKAIVREWLQNHQIRDVVRHSDIDPKRKQDPGKGFPWMPFLHSVNI